MGRKHWARGLIRMVPLLLVLSACADEITPTAPSEAVVAAPETPRTYVECDPMQAIIECDPGPGPGSQTPPPGISLPYTWSSCLTAMQDSDADGIDDNCEIALASAFAPMLMVAQGECNWDYALNRVGGEYYYMVRQPHGGSDRIRIAYMPAYYRDCSSHQFGNPHAGDSEFIGVDVAYSSGRWVFLGAMLSAHCGAYPIPAIPMQYSPDCRYYPHFPISAPGFGGSWEYVDGVARGAPKVWVAAGKHANYRSRSACENSEAGHLGIDNCPPNAVDRRFPIVHRWQNVEFPESSALTCTQPRWGSSLPDPNARETFGRWQPFCVSTFRGWSASMFSGSSTSYDAVIRGYLRMYPPDVFGPPYPTQCMEDPIAIIPAC